jgi:hypothetical protein
MSIRLTADEAWLARVQAATSDVFGDLDDDLPRFGVEDQAATPACSMRSAAARISQASLPVAVPAGRRQRSLRHLRRGLGGDGVAGDRPRQGDDVRERRRAAQERRRAAVPGCGGQLVLLGAGRQDAPHRLIGRVPAAIAFAQAASSLPGSCLSARPMMPWAARSR